MRNSRPRTRLLSRSQLIAKRLCTAAGVGLVTAITFVATIDRVKRVAHAQQARAYLGLVPRELSSTETQRRGHITKGATDARVRF